MVKIVVNFGATIDKLSIRKRKKIVKRLKI